MYGTIKMKIEKKTYEYTTYYSTLNPNTKLLASSTNLQYSSVGWCTLEHTAFKLISGEIQSSF